MSKIVKLKRGFDIKLEGAAEKRTAEAPQPELFALKPTDFYGVLRPKPMVDEGDNVKAGTPILYDKKQDNIMFTAPVSGEIVEIKRGEKRKLLEIKILADKEIEYEKFNSYSISDIQGLNKDTALEQLLKSGVWPNIIQRPYGVIADPEAAPKAIFISAFDTHPLAPDYAYLFRDQAHHMEAGISILKKFSEHIHVNTDSTAEIASIFANVDDVQMNKFSGPHPAGNVGVQIHHIDPINKGDVVWTLNPQGVIEIGRLFLEGKYDTSRLVALTGSEVKSPAYYKTYAGACVNKMLEDNLTNDHVRVISGNVLTGEKVSKEGFVGYYHHQVTVIPEGDDFEFLGWIKPSARKLSFHRAFGLFSFMNDGPFKVDTNMNGEERAFVQTGTFESVTPMDILPTHLIKAIMAEDYDDMEALGIYEVVEEDFALCEFVDVSKHPIQKIIRDGINLIQYT